MPVPTRVLRLFTNVLSRGLAAASLHRLWTGTGPLKKFAASCVALCLLGGCGAKGPPPKEDILVDITFSAAPDVNPSAKGRPSPVAVMLLELKGTSAFEEADCVTLFTDPKKTLGEELLPGHEKFILRPGARKRIQRTANPEIVALGFAAGYRELQTAEWQVVHDVPEAPEAGMFSSALKIKLDVRLGASEITVTPSGGK